MPHMIPQAEYMTCVQIETTHGTETVPADLVGTGATIQACRDYLEGKPRDDTELEYVTGWFARLSAPGYMDQTEWSGPYATEKEARDYISGQYDVDGETGEDLSD